MCLCFCVVCVFLVVLLDVDNRLFAQTWLFVYVACFLLCVLHCKLLYVCTFMNVSVVFVIVDNRLLCVVSLLVCIVLCWMLLGVFVFLCYLCVVGCVVGCR